MLPDDVIEPTVAMSEMIRVRQEHGGSVLLAVGVEPSQVANYGAFDVKATDDDRVKKLWAWWKSLRLRLRRRIWWPRGATLWTARFWLPSPYHSRQGRGAAAYRRHRSPHFRRPPRPRRGP